MTPDKLEALRRLAADERTPIEEARNAALAFVRGGGQAKSPVEEFVPKADLRKVEKERDDIFDRAKTLAEEAMRLKNEAEKLLAENEKLRGIVRRVVDASRAEKEAAELVARWDGEAKGGNGGGWVVDPPYYAPGRVSGWAKAR